MRPAVYPERSRRGYTLIELLVVIAIVSILALVGFVNFKNFSADQVTNKAAGEVQSILRLAQSNATTSTFCGSQSGVSWTAVFNLDGVSINLVCGPTNSLQRTFTLTNAQIQIKGSGCVSPSSLPISVTYASRIGSLTFISGDTCLVTSSYLTITLSNTKDISAAKKSFNLSKGGAIDVN